jgi:steroid delta-isomerase-like uncharacterized protein
MADWMQPYLDAWNSRDGSQVAAFMAEDATYEDLALGQLHSGRDAIATFAAGTAEFSKDYRFDSVSEQSSGDSYALEWEFTGTHTGDAGPIPATNKPFKIRGVSVGRLDSEGKIKQNRDYWNMADFLVQIGILPPPS